MLADLNNILDGLTELEEKGVETIDCRRAQFSAQEPIVRLRMICQSWKVMFQAEYSSGQPLRMLVDLRASVDAALGRTSEAESGEKAAEATAAAKAAPAKGAEAKSIAIKTPPRAAAAGATGASAAAKASAKVAVTPKAKFAVAKEDTEEFEVSAAPEWNPDADSPTGQKK
jgi:hypothetical protein